MSQIDGWTIGHYQVEEQLGQGGMGAVYRAYNTRARRYVALKLMLENDAQDPSRPERFRREARLLLQLDNPHVVPVNDFGEIDGRLYLDMELIEGEDLKTVLARGPLPPARAVAIIEHVAAALDSVHAKHLVHRDVKPANIVLTRAGDAEHAYLVDFGIARSTADSTGLTATGMLIGTVSYLAPEVCAGETATPRSDVYALGCVLFECLTGTRVFSGSDYAVLDAHRNRDPRPLSAFVPGLPVALEDVVRRALTKDPARRTTSASSLASEARAAITARGQHTRTGMPVWGRPAPVPPQAKPVPRRPPPPPAPPLRAAPATTTPGLPPGLFDAPVRLHPPAPGGRSARSKEKAFLTGFAAVALLLTAVLVTLALVLSLGS